MQIIRHCFIIKYFINLIIPLENSLTNNFISIKNYNLKNYFQNCFIPIIINFAKLWNFKDFINSIIMNYIIKIHFIKFFTNYFLIITTITIKFPFFMIFLEIFTNFFLIKINSLNY